jgi:hypothetical protein
MRTVLAVLIVIGSILQRMDSLAEAGVPEVIARSLRDLPHTRRLWFGFAAFDFVAQASFAFHCVAAFRVDELVDTTHSYLPNDRLPRLQPRAGTGRPWRRRTSVS